jgi:outer membrane protein OmpA-like peptidoglycan-associated protein
VRGIKALFLAACVFMPQAVVAGRLEVAAGLSQPALNDFEQPWAVGGSFCIAYRHPLAPRWSLLAGGRYSRYLNDRTSTATIRFLLPNHLADEGWRLFDIDVGVEYSLATGRATIPYLRFLASNSFWKVYRLSDGRTIPVQDGDGNPTDFASQEVVFRGAAGLHYQIHPQLGVAVESELSYYSGLGTDFSTLTSDRRSRAAGALFLKLTYRPRSAAGSRPPRFAKPALQPEGALPLPVAVGPASGDVDGDGVPDLADRCPGTPAQAVGWVDVYGCPVDFDHDGVPDYLDRCAGTPAGAQVNDDGCVVDSDGDGVPDLADRCPGTEAGAKVDAVGCPSYPALTEKLVFRFNYEPGGADLDADARAQLLTLVPTLKFNTGLKIKVEGFTDDSGPADANMALAQKRADRAKEFLVGQGIAGSRITAVGKGEADFVTSNDTPEGRAQNRRIEISPAP